MKKLIMTILMTTVFTFSMLLIGCEKKPAKEVKKVGEPNKVTAVEPNVAPSARTPREERGPGAFGERRGTGRRGFDPTSMLKSLDPNSLEKLKKDFPNLNFSDPNSIRQDPNAMRAIGELMRARGGFGGFGEMGPGGFGPGGFGPRDANQPFEPNKPTEPNELVALNLKDVEIKSAIQFLADWTGKIIIPNGELMKQRVTIYSSKRVSKEQALEMIYTALKEKGYTRVEDANSIILKPIAQAKLEAVPVIDPNMPLAAIKDKSLIVQKTFQLESYSPAQMSQFIQPLVDQYGQLISDEASRKLLVIESVGNLIRLEKIIKQFDVPGAGIATTSKIFELKYTDPVEIVQLLNQLLSTQTTVGTRVTRPSRTFGGFGERTTPQPTIPSVSEALREVKAPAVSGVASSVTISSTKGPIILYPEPKRKWIIARASVEDMKIIEERIKELDVKTEVESQWETIPLKYVSASEVEDAINSSLREMSSTVGIQNVYVQPLENAKQLLVFGSKENREIIKKLVENIDVPAPVIPSKTFKLKYRDADEVKKKIDEHYQAATSSTSTTRRMFGGFGGFRAAQAEEVYVISFPSTNEVTVRASESTLKQIEMMIEEWDVEPKPIPPRIIELRNTDPIKMVDMLNQLFGGGAQGATRQMSVFDMLFGGGAATQEKIIGAYYGTVSFQEVPGAKKIIISCKIPEAYDFFEQVVRDMDKAEPAEMPEIVVLKYADPEDLSERLNALFNEPGTQARIRRTTKGIEYTIQQEETTTTTGQQQQTTTSATEYTPPWSGTGARTTVGTEMPISNIIGKIRFVPDPRTKAILVLAPSEYIEGIVSKINELDKPGKQVMIEVVIVEVDQSKLNNVGTQFASDPTAFGGLNENSIRALFEPTHQESHGSMSFGAAGTSGSSFKLNVGADINVLIDFLVKYADAKVINKQSVYTKDNANAEFFKGEEIAFESASTVTTGGTVTRSYDYKEIGITLRVRPNITPEKNVDMIIDLALSQLSQDLVNTQPRTPRTRNTSSMIVKDGQTIKLGSILTQKDSNIQRKVPLLGDIPIIGEAFRHRNSLQSNNEMLVFITPHVVDEEINPEKVIPDFSSSINKMEKISKELAEQWLEKVE